MMEDGCAENLRAATDADVLKQGLEDVNLLTEKGTRRQIWVWTLKVWLDLVVHNDGLSCKLATLIDYLEYLIE